MPNDPASDSNSAFFIDEYASGIAALGLLYWAPSVETTQPIAAEAGNLLSRPRPAANATDLPMRPPAAWTTCS